MTVYLGKQNVDFAVDVAHTHRTVLQSTRKVDSVRHKFMHNYAQPLTLGQYVEEGKASKPLC